MRTSTAISAFFALLLALLLTAGSCDTGQNRSSTGGHDFPPPAATPAGQPQPAPHPTKWDNTPATGVGAPSEIEGPPVVNGDAGPQNDSHYVVYQLIFVSPREVGGTVEYVDQNGNNVPAVPVKTTHRNRAGAGKGYGGSWEHIEKSHTSIAMGFTWYPAAEGGWAMCTLLFNGAPVDYQIVQSGPCAVSFTLPGDLPKPRNPGPVK